MKVLSVLLSTAIMVMMMAASVKLYRDTVCRQRTWGRAFELRTRRLLTASEETETGRVLSCKTVLLRQSEEVTWVSLGTLKKQNFNLDIQGKL